MKLTEIKYKNKIIRVSFKDIEEYGYFETDDNTLVINKNLTKQMLGKTLFHELFHIIVTLNNFTVLNYGEERVASLTEQYYTILKSNPTLKNLIVIPLVGQMIHFYLDTFLWRFQEQHHRDVTYKYI